MSVASCLCLSAPPGRAGSVYTRRTRRLHPGHKPVYQRPYGAVCKRKPSCEVQADQAPSLRSTVLDPDLVNTLRAVSFDCWPNVDLEAMVESPLRLRQGDDWGLPDGVYKELTFQEQADHISIAFLYAVYDRLQLQWSQLSLKDYTQHIVHNTLSLVTVIAAFQQVMLEGS